MDVWRITVAALRRWYVLLPLLALTGYAAVTVGEGVRPQYEVTATATLVPGSIESEIANPYGGLDETNTVLTIVLSNTASRAQVSERGLDPEYQITPRERSAIMDFTVLSDTPELGIGTGEAVFELARQELTERQDEAGIRPAAHYGLQVLQAPSVSEVVAEGKMRNIAIVAIVGAAFSLLAALLFDDLVGLIKRRMRKRRERRAAKHGVSAATVEDGKAQQESGEQSSNGVGAATTPTDESKTVTEKRATVPGGGVDRAAAHDPAQVGRDG